jgi:TonB-dependent receptor
VKENFYIRAGIGRQVLLPRIGEMDNALNLNTGRVFSGTSKDQQRTIGTRGNPYLQPITSDQFDLSFEWYPRDNDLYSIALFYKDMDGVYEKNADYIDVEGIDLPMPIITTVKTERPGTISGIEVAFRTELDFLPGALKNFALAGNYTWMDIDTVQDYNPNETYKEDFDWIAYTETLYLAEGMMESTGALVLSYDDGQRWSGRLAYKYQDYVVTQGYNLRRPSNFWSGAVNFRINQRFQLVAQVWNLTNEKTTAGHIGSKNIGEPFPDYPRRVQADSRTWRLGVRMRF